MRISASCLYIARCYFGNQLVLQSSDLEGSYNTDPGHGYSGSWFVFSSVCLFSKPALDLNYVRALRLLVPVVGACPLLSPQGLAYQKGLAPETAVFAAMLEKNDVRPQDALKEYGITDYGDERVHNALMTACFPYFPAPRSPAAGTAFSETSDSDEDI
jgi:hypothetical protein